MIELAIFIFLILSLQAQSSCLELLKDHLNFNQDQVAHYQELIQRYEKKEAKLLESLNENKVSPNAPAGAGVYLREYIDKFEMNPARKAIIEFI